MEISCTVPEKRTWIFFFLILLAGLLWASFLMIQGQMPEMSVLLAIISVFISLFSFIHCTRHRTWIFFYLIVLVAVLWASFLLMQGAMIWISAFLFLVAGGTTIFSFLLIEPQPPAA
ncbi:MAG: hypothetical protein Q7T80_06030 [Methanoregula sp.]|nr:hypothetical protein [Methanoregula sp.]